MKTKGSVLSAYKFISDEDVEMLCTSTGVNINKNDIFLYDIGMGHSHGYGQYTLSVIVDINGTNHTFTKHSTNSILYDALKESEVGDGKYEEIMTGIFKTVMESNEDELAQIEDTIKEEEEEDE